ncbi:MAG: serine hydrolase [Pirellulales bacterium]|nr:serine hydrolase [Pirellulales bacterium]
MFCLNAHVEKSRCRFISRSIGICLHLVFAVLAVALAAQSVAADAYPIEKWKKWDRQRSDRMPGEQWMRYASPEEAGWSSGKLAEAKAFSEKLGSAAVMIVYDGAVVAQWGPVHRRYMCHSVRKSLMSAMYGAQMPEGKIDLQKTLAELGIDDCPPLTDQEKQARVIDLLTARSGVYHRAAYETKTIKASRPQRGSHKPGEHFWYNNWDFNTLCTIFEQETGKRFFEEFKRRFADPLAMQDFRVRDGYYHREKWSIHPAYPFRLSARDMARIGLLFLHEGKWGDRRILSKEWVEKSTAPISYRPEHPRSPEYAYSYLWWRLVEGRMVPTGLYSARGFGGHAIDVFPAANTVVVHRVDTFWDMAKGIRKEKPEVSNDDRLELLEKILDARTGPPKNHPKLVPVEEPRLEVKTVQLSPEQAARYQGIYKFARFKMTIKPSEDNLLVSSPKMGTFTLLPLGCDRFWVEDLEAIAQFYPGKRRRPAMLSVEFIPGEPTVGARLGDTRKGPRHARGHRFRLWRSPRSPG